MLILDLNDLFCSVDMKNIWLECVKMSIDYVLNVISIKYIL